MAATFCAHVRSVLLGAGIASSSMQPTGRERQTSLVGSRCASLQKHHFQELGIGRVRVAERSMRRRSAQICAASSAPVLPFRVGHGFDLHRLEPDRPLIIGGVTIPHDRGCDAHSDGDVLMHCIVDAILGALSLPDIGQLFPDNDPKWKGAASSVFVKEAIKRMREAGYSLGNLDATVILQRPKLSPHKEAIKKILCELLEADPSVINVKAKTHEKVDSLGENRSIACHTVVLLVKDS